MEYSCFLLMEQDVVVLLSISCVSILTNWGWLLRRSSAGLFNHLFASVRNDTHWFLNELRGRRGWDGCLLRPGDEAAVPSGKVCTRTSLSFCLCSPAFPPSPLLSSLDAACVFLSTEGSSAWIIRLRCYWCIKLRVWFLSRPCHQSQFARALAECNISLIGSTRKLRSWTVLIREEIIKLGAPGKITLWALL